MYKLSLTGGLPASLPYWQALPTMTLFPSHQADLSPLLAVTSARANNLTLTRCFAATISIEFRVLLQRIVGHSFFSGKVG